jgi:hypothetical protein
MKQRRISAPFHSILIDDANHAGDGILAFLDVDSILAFRILDRECSLFAYDFPFSQKVRITERLGMRESLDAYLCCFRSPKILDLSDRVDIIHCETFRKHLHGLPLGRFAEIHLGNCPWIETYELFASEKIVLAHGAVTDQTLASLSRCNDVDLTLCRGISSVSCLVGVERLSISGCYRLNDECFGDIGKIGKIKYLDMSGCIWITEGGLAELQSLEHLVVADCVLPVLPYLPNLKVLDATGCDFSRIEETVQNLPMLEMICVADCGNSMYDLAQSPNFKSFF